MGDLVRNKTLPDSSDKTDFHDLIAGSSGATIGAGKVTNAHLAGSIADSKLNQLTTANKVAVSAVGTRTVVLTSSSNVTTIANAALSSFYTLSLDEATTIADPTVDANIGQGGIIEITQDGGTGSLSGFGDKWVSSDSVGDIVLSTTDGYVDSLAYYYNGTNYVIVAFETNVTGNTP